MSIEQRVVAHLKILGVKAEYEYPGFVGISISRTSYAAFGTINEYWSGDLHHGDVVSGIDFPQLAVNTHPVVVADRIVETLNKIVESE